MDGTLEYFLDDLISVNKVKRIWQLDNIHLAEIINKMSLNCLEIEDKRIIPNNGKTICICRYSIFFEGYGYNNSNIYNPNGKYFIFDEIKKCEKAMPWLQYSLAADTLDTLEAHWGEWIPANEICRFLRKSPNQFIAMMNRGEGPISSMEEEYQEGRKFSVSDMAKGGDSEFYFHVLDLQAWLNEQNKQGEQPGEPVANFSLAELQAALEQANTQNAALRTELAQARAQIEQFRQGEVPAPAPCGNSSLAGLQVELARANSRIEALQAELDKANSEKQEALGKLDALAKAARMPEDWTKAGNRGQAPIARVVGMRMQGMTDANIAEQLKGETVKGEGKENDCFNQSQIGALLAPDGSEFSQLSISQVGVLLDAGGYKNADTHKTNAKRLLREAK